MSHSSEIPLTLLRQATVLAVDDNAENLNILSDLLQPVYRVRGATSGMRALEIALAFPRPDIILLDIMMPGMDGFAVLERLREDPLTHDIPVIFITALDDPDEEEHGLDLGAVDYITKPFRPNIVLARINAQLELKYARDLLSNQNDLLEKEVALRMHENQLIQDVSIHALAHLAEIRDPETGNHIRRTQEYVRVLATQLKSHPAYADYLSNRTVEILTKSAPLHDIGKVGIPDHVLLKPGKLTSDEWEIMKSHAVLGFDAIERAEHDIESRVDFLATAKLIARHHHERWDGSGYPDGLFERNIPLPARLMALADVFDALINRRVYKEAIPVDESRDIIIADRGRHFDPDVVDAFLARYDAFLQIARRYSDMESISP